MKQLITNGLYIASDEKLFCMMTGFNLYKDIRDLKDMTQCPMEGARALIYTNDISLIHPFVKTLLGNNFIGDLKVEVKSESLKETYLMPLLNVLLNINNSIVQRWNSLHTPTGYMTVNVFNTKEVDLYLMDANKQDLSSFSKYTQYNIRGRKLYRTTKENMFKEE